jgi:5-oxoprolinase (ATP-hydrolysing)
LIITKGFKDLILIGNQSRPQIFDLNIRRPDPLYSAVIEVDERVTLVGYASDPEAAEHAIQFDDNGKIVKPYSGEAWIETDSEKPEIVQGISGEAVHILHKPDQSKVRADLQRLYKEGYRSIAVVFAHSYTFPDHELFVGDIAKEIGFTQISLSSQLLPMIKMLPRGVSSTADAYLTPILREYLDGFFSGFDEELRGSGKAVQEGNKRHARVEFMGSDGGLLDLNNFSGLKSILSGPAGGVVGYALTSWDEKVKKPIIGSVFFAKPAKHNILIIFVSLDVGGTSTDVSRFSGRYEVTYETTTAGISIQSPQLDINTVAAGGGSCLTFSNGLFKAGPESAGAQPGPACYRSAVTLHDIKVNYSNSNIGRVVHWR